MREELSVSFSIQELLDCRRQAIRCGGQERRPVELVARIHRRFRLQQELQTLRDTAGALAGSEARAGQSARTLPSYPFPASYAPFVSGGSVVYFQPLRGLGGLDAFGYIPRSGPWG